MGLPCRLLSFGLAALVWGLAPPLAAQSGLNISTGFDQEGRVVLGDGAEDLDYRVTGPVGSGIGPRPARVVAADGFPIPPWFEGPPDTRWIGLDGGDSAGPAGDYLYEVAFELGPETNPEKVEVLGGWAAAEEGVSVSLNGVPLNGPPAGQEGFSVLGAGAGRGLFVRGRNAILFQVRSTRQGPTGLRTDLRIDSVPNPDPLDISTGFHQSSAHTLSDGDPDDDYTVTARDSDTREAVVLSALPAGWMADTPSSRWIGLPAGSPAPADPHTYQILVEIGTEEEAALAELVGGLGAGGRASDVMVNGASTGFSTSRGPSALTFFPAGIARGLFAQGTNSIEFVVEPEGGPPGLRVDARVAVGPIGTRFVRGDVQASGLIDIADPIAGLSYFFLGGETPPCLDALDANDDGVLDISDPSFLLGYLFLGGPPPEPPRGSCGDDPTQDGVACAGFPACP